MSNEQEKTQDDQRTLALLWGERVEPKRGPKPSLTVERIVQAAVAVADAEGVDALSMQRVAQACGVTTMALYRYVPGKAELIALMLDIGLGEPPQLEDAVGGWRPQLELWAQRLSGIFRQHPWSLAATALARPMGPNELHWFEVAVGALAATALDSSDARASVITLLLHVRGMASYTVDAAGAHWAATVGDLVTKHRENYPALALAEAAGAFRVTGSERPDIGLRLILDGIGMRIAEAERSSAG